MKEVVKIQVNDGSVFDNKKQAVTYLNSKIEEHIGVLVDMLYIKLGAHVKSKLDVYNFIYENLQIFTQANEIKKDIENLEELNY